MGKVSTDSRFDPSSSSPRYGHFWFHPAGHTWGPNEPILGPTDTVSGPNGSKHGKKATQTAPKLIFVHQIGQQNLLGRPTEALGPVFGDFGPFWARLGPHLGPAPGTATRAHGALWRSGHGPSGSQRWLFVVPTPSRIVVTFVFSILGPLLLWGPPRACGASLLLARRAGSIHPGSLII